jgi:hypothetical protein
MKERVRRVRVLFKELGYHVYDDEYLEESYTAGFEDDDSFAGGLFIDRESKFLEIGFTFSFSANLAEYIRDRMQEMLHLCYEYGVYVNVETSPEEIAFSIFSKLYFAGLNYYSLKETLRDFRSTIDAIVDLVEIRTAEE